MRTRTVRLARALVLGLVLAATLHGGEDCASLKLLPVDPVEFLSFGLEVDAETDRLVVGAFETAFIIERVGAEWLQAAELSNPSTLNNYGWPVALSGELAAVAATGLGDDPGAVVIFERAGDGWTPTSQLDGDTEAGYFGWSLAVDGELLVVGAPRENDEKGRVHVYRRVDGEWLEEAVLLPPPTLQWFEGFGWEIAIDGDRIAIGDYSEWTDSSLRVVTFRHDDGEWVQESILDYSSDLGAIYGVWIDLHDEFMVVNGRYGDFNYLYEWVDDAWIQRGEFYGNSVLYAGQASIDRNYVLEVFGPEGGRLHGRDGDSWIELVEFAGPNNEWLPWGVVELSGAWAIVGDQSDQDAGAYFGGAVHLIPLPIDCNNNGVSDACDIATGASSDANADGVPDDCQPNSCPRGGCENLDIAGNDCVINLGDLGLLLANFNREGWDIAGDSDIDGDVDLADLGAMLAAWGSNCGWQEAEDEAK